MGPHPNKNPVIDISAIVFAFLGILFLGISILLFNFSWINPDDVEEIPDIFLQLQSFLVQDFNLPVISANRVMFFCSLGFAAIFLLISFIVSMMDKEELSQAKSISSGLAGDTNTESKFHPAIILLSLITVGILIILLIEWFIGAI